MTTDETKADPYAWKCTVAMPLLDYANGTRADFSHDLNCTTASKSTDYDAITDFANPGDMFYDKVAKFVGDGSNDRVRIPTVLLLWERVILQLSFGAFYGNW